MDAATTQMATLTVFVTLAGQVKFITYFGVSGYFDYLSLQVIFVRLIFTLPRPLLHKLATWLVSTATAIT